MKYKHLLKTHVAKIVQQTIVEDQSGHEIVSTLNDKVLIEALDYFKKIQPNTIKFMAKIAGSNTRKSFVIIKADLDKIKNVIIDTLHHRATKN